MLQAQFKKKKSTWDALVDFCTEHIGFETILVGQEMTIGYNICFETPTEYCSLGPIFAHEPINENDVRNILDKYIDDEVRKLDYTQIYNMLIIASDGNQVQYFAANPYYVWPTNKNRKLYNAKGGEK